MWTTKTWPERVEEFLKSDQSMADKYSWPFPMGVFGTLRERQGNNPRMHAGKFYDHRYAFLPHFYAQGLSVGFDKNSCAPFEVFYYESDEWKKMIPGVDSLEGFSPRYACDGRGEWGYYRTLVWLSLLPEQTSDSAVVDLTNNKWFPKEGRADLWERRDMKIDPTTWDKYERVPCWVYSNVTSNRNLQEMLSGPGIVPPHLQVKVSGPNPLIWPKPKLGNKVNSHYDD